MSLVSWNGDTTRGDAQRGSTQRAEPPGATRNRPIKAGEHGEDGEHAGLAPASIAEGWRVGLMTTAIRCRQPAFSSLVRVSETLCVPTGGAASRCSGVNLNPERRMHSLLKRHALQVLLAAGHTPEDVVRLLSVSASTVGRVAREEVVSHVDDKGERKRRRIGRPSKTEPFRKDVEEILATEPALMSLEILRLMKMKGYEGSKSALFELIRELRPPKSKLQMRFEGLPGEFSQHDFGQVDVRFVDGSKQRIHFFASRLKWSRHAEVSLVPNEQAETLVRTLLDHFVAFGGVPLCAVFDRPKTVALKWNQAGEITEWNPTFAYAALEVGFTAEVCWAYQPQQKGSVEAIVKWVKNSFFKQRRFIDMEDLLAQLHQWLHEINCARPSSATDIIPAERMREEQPRLRAPKVRPENLALRIPVSVGPTAVVIHETNEYSMPPEAANLPATLHLYRNRVRIVAGRHEATHDRLFGRKERSHLAEHRAASLAHISGRRGRRYLKRQHLFNLGEDAVIFLTELVHLHPRDWYSHVDRLHELLQLFGDKALRRALREANIAGQPTVHYVQQCLGYDLGAAILPNQLNLQLGEVN